MKMARGRQRYADRPSTVHRVGAFEDIISFVRPRWPDADIQGSAGLERSILAGNGDLVAHAWVQIPRKEPCKDHIWSVRVFDSPVEW